MDHKRCLLCHRKLKSTESQTRGMGPKCWGKLLRLDKQEKKRQKEKHEATKLKDQVLNGQVSLFDKGMEE